MATQTIVKDRLTSYTYANEVTYHICDKSHMNYN